MSVQILLFLLRGAPHTSIFYFSVIGVFFETITDTEKSVKNLANQSRTEKRTKYTYPNCHPWP